MFLFRMVISSLSLLWWREDDVEVYYQMGVVKMGTEKLESEKRNTFDTQ